MSDRSVPEGVSIATTVVATVAIPLLAVGGFVLFAQHRERKYREYQRRQARTSQTVDTTRESEVERSSHIIALTEDDSASCRRSLANSIYDTLTQRAVDLGKRDRLRSETWALYRRSDKHIHLVCDIPVALGYEREIAEVSAYTDRDHSRLRFVLRPTSPKELADICLVDTAHDGIIDYISKIPRGGMSRSAEHALSEDGYTTVLFLTSESLEAPASIERR